MTETLNNCRVGSCTIGISGNHILCQEHFNSIPTGLRTAVYRAKHKGVSSPQYQAAVERAIEAAQAIDRGEGQE